MKYIPKIEFDKHPFLRAGSFVIICISIMQIIQGILRLYSPYAGDATNIKALLMFLKNIGIDYIYLGLSYEIKPWILVIAGVLGLFGTLLRLGWIRIASFIPQHFILGTMAIGAIYAAYIGQYLDGTPMHWEHILTDQIPVIALFLVHSNAIIRRVNDPNG